MPTSPLLGLSLLALPGVALGARTLLRAAGLGPKSEGVLLPGVTFVLWFMSVHAIGLITRSFVTGLWLGAMLSGLAGTLAFRLDRARRVEAHATPRVRSRADAVMLGCAALAALILAPAAFRHAFHDELFVTGHFSIASQIQNDVYPPRHLSFPEFVLPYHFGFNLAAAAVGALLRIRIDHAIDLLTVAAFAYSFCLAWRLSDALGGSAVGGFLAAVVLCFSGRLPTPCSETRSLGFDLLGYCGVGGALINPPPISYFFQHPWTVGFPMGLAVLIVMVDREARGPRARLAILWLLLLVLSISQVILFFCLAGVLLGTELLHGWRSRRALAELSVFVLVLVPAVFLSGGLGRFVPDAEGLGILFRGSLGDSPLGTLAWHFESFGLVLPLGLIGLFLLLRERLAFTLLIAGSLIVVNCFRYRFTWDIVKFANVASMGLSFPCARAIEGLWFASRGALRGPTVAVAIAATTLSGLLFAGVLGFVPRDHLGGLFTFTDEARTREDDLAAAWLLTLLREPDALTPDDAAAISWLRTTMRPGDAVYRNASHARAYALWGGLPIPFVDSMTHVVGFSEARIARRRGFLQSLPSDPDLFLENQVRWLVIGDDEPRLRTLAEHFLGLGRAVSRLRTGSLEIFELVPASR